MIDFWPILINFSLFFLILGKTNFCISVQYCSRINYFFFDFFCFFQRWFKNWSLGNQSKNQFFRSNLNVSRKLPFLTSLKCKILNLRMYFSQNQFFLIRATWNWSLNVATSWDYDIKTTILKNCLSHFLGYGKKLFVDKSYWFYKNISLGKCSLPMGKNVGIVFQVICFQENKGK